MLFACTARIVTSGGGGSGECRTEWNVGEGGAKTECSKHLAVNGKDKSLLVCACRMLMNKTMTVVPSANDLCSSLRT